MSSGLNTHIKDQKQGLRRQIQQQKSLLSLSEIAEKSQRIWTKVEALPAFQKAHTVLLYWSLADEVHTHEFVLKWYQSKTLLLPLVNGDNLELRHFTGMDCMQKGSHFGILEPWKGAERSPEIVEFAIIPGVAFDRAGQRMGRGKGYYDRLLQQQSIYTVGVALACQMVEQVPVDVHDQPMRCVITDV